MVVGRSEWLLHQDQLGSDRECSRSSYRVECIQDPGSAESVEESFPRIFSGCPGSAGSRKAGERSYTAPGEPDPQRPAGLVILMSDV